MNFLAHLYLSGNDDELKIGNFIGDAVKGRDLSEYSPRVQDGIRLHRGIDRYTDTHPIVLKSKLRLRPKYHKYAPVIVDMFYDHFLASLWADYSKVPLEAFIHSCHDLLNSQKDMMPNHAQYILPYMIEGQWLLGYRELSGLDCSLTGMSERSSFKSNMEHATADLEKDYESYRQEFQSFFPDLEKFVRTFTH
ncbi:MAG: DUF479 domain-containing protein [Flavobacteriales bacterium]|nr:DUF479 domain-containing protein [Flavobacteriales bacterium]